MFAGFLLVLIGVVFLLKNMGVILGVSWDIIWPVILIALGVSFMSNQPYRYERRMWRRMWKDDPNKDHQK